jgi:AcrR family transcriptional regulator
MPAPSRKPPTRATRRRRDDAPAAGESPTAPPRRRREQEVLDIAARLFHERGYAHTSVQDIADELGILKGSLYHYIEVKEDLLFRLLEQLHDDTREILEAAAAAEGLTPLGRLELYVRRSVLFDLDNLSRVAVYYNEYERLSPERRSVIVQRRRLHERWVAGLLAQAQADGHADALLDPGVVSNFIHGTVIWTYRWYRPRGRVSREKVADQCVAFVMRGVVGTPGASGVTLNGA